MPVNVRTLWSVLDSWAGCLRLGTVVTPPTVGAENGLDRVGHLHRLVAESARGILATPISVEVPLRCRMPFDSRQAKPHCGRARSCHLVERAVGQLGGRVTAFTIAYITLRPTSIFLPRKVLWRWRRSRRRCSHVVRTEAATLRRASFRSQGKTVGVPGGAVSWRWYPPPRKDKRGPERAHDAEDFVVTKAGIQRHLAMKSGVLLME